MNIDSTIPGWMPVAGAAVMILMLAGVILMIIKDIYIMEYERETWAEPNYYPPMPVCKKPKNEAARRRLDLKRHTGVNIEEITITHKKVRLPKSGKKT